MGRKLSYSPGSFYRTDDRTGFPQRAERTRREWTGLIVDETVWEARQPQDLVRGVRDQQNVPDARPLAPNQFTLPIYAQMTDGAGIGDTVIELASVSRFEVGGAVQVMMDSGEVWLTTVEAIGAGQITLTDALPYPAASGNLVAYLGLPAASGSAAPDQAMVTTEDDFMVTTDGDYMVWV